MELTAEETRLSEEAFEFMKSHERELIARFADPALHKPDVRLVSLFMAGSPGAGKTETSKRLVENFARKPIRIDADEIRALCPGYVGDRAYLYQKAANKGVNLLYDYALEQGLNVILDGTFAYGGAGDNVERSLQRGRKVELYYVWQEPKRAWELVVAREAIEHRKVTRDVFAHALVTARQNVDEIKQRFGDRIELNLIIKDFESKDERLELNIPSVDPYLPKSYSETEVLDLIGT